MTDINKALKDLDKKFGAGKVFNLGSNDALNVDRISTGLISLDTILGGGLPIGRIVEVMGWEMSAKTTLCQRIIAEVQSQGERCAIVDAENALDRKWIETCGASTNELYISQPDFGEEGLEIVEALVKSGVFRVIVVDSVSTLIPRAEVEGSIGDAHMALQARMMAQALRKLSTPVKENKVILIFTNQYRKNITNYGSPNVSSGGNSLRFYASIRLELARIQTITQATEAIGTKIKVKVIKNKTAPPFQECELRLYFDRGFSKEADLLLIAVEKGIVAKRGSWFSYNDDQVKEQGETNFVRLLEKNAELYERIKQEVLSVE